MQLNPYLTFNGQCESAFKFYERCLGGKIIALIPHAGTPAEQHTPPEWRNKILHATLNAGGAVLMGSDAPGYQQPQGMSVSLQVKTPEEADRIFAALSENGTVRLPIQQTFFSPRFGMLTDQFGIPWMINCEQPA
jgi:PhnB protein